MLTEERFAKILSILEHMGSVTVQQLMTELDASESTVRRDLNTLDANGQLVKVHGGAILKNTVYSTIDDEVVYRKEQNREAKDKIARYAAGLITAEDFPTARIANATLSKTFIFSISLKSWKTMPI